MVIARREGKKECMRLKCQSQSCVEKRRHVPGGMRNEKKPRNRENSQRLIVHRVPVLSERWSNERNDPLGDARDCNIPKWRYILDECDLEGAESLGNWQCEKENVDAFSWGQ